MHYREPGWLDRHLFNQVVGLLTRLGLSVWGSRVLEVRGRTTGELRRTPVNLLRVNGESYLVAPRGHTHWVRNLRAAHAGCLLIGRRRQPFVATELPDADKEHILREYLKRWKWEVGQFFDGVSADSPSEELARIAPRHPVFRIDDR